jgi:twitching motility protein PilT
MAAIDSLLGIVDLKKADGLVLATDQVPVLLLGGGRSPLTMPPMSAAMVDATLAELLTPELRATLASAGEVETRHSSASLGTFQVRVRIADGRTTVTLEKGDGAGTAAPPASAAPASSPAATHLASQPAGVTSPAESEPGPLAAALDLAMTRRASDVLLSTGVRPRVRVEGEWVEVEAPPVAASDLERAFVSRLADERRHALDQTGSVDLAFVRNDPRTGEDVRFRVNLFRQHTGLTAALRPLWTILPTLSDLHLPAALLPIVSLRHGLVVMTGATGSGKSTTLAALLDHVNHTRTCHIVTLEDPIEYLFRRDRALIHQREIGAHVNGFASGLRAALRESPDIILVGEMRDPETIRLALTAAETGHLVMSTLHSGSAAMAIDRIVDVFGEAEKSEVRQQLAGTLRHVIAQQLIPTPNGDRIPVLEMLTVTHAVAAQIREGRTHFLAAQMEIEAGERMVTMERALAELVRTGRLGRQAALEASQRRDELLKLLDERTPPAATRR